MSGTPEPVTAVVACDLFGHIVAESFRRLRPDRTTLINPDAPMDLTDTFCSSLTAIGTSATTTQLCDSWTQIAVSAQIPFVPLVLNSRTLRIGPVFIPGHGCCCQCWNLRQQQHGLLVEHSTHGNLFSEGHAAFALMAATRLDAIINAITCLELQPGFIWEMDTLTLRSASSRATAVHGCLLCGLRRSEATRTVDELRHALVDLFVKESE